MNPIEVKDLSFSYDQHLDVVKDVSFSVERGSYTTLIGHNGSGKSTIVKILTGITTATKGCIYLEGKQISGKGRKKKLEKKCR